MRSSPRARATAWVRLVAPSFSIMWLTCFLTVSMLTTSCVAMALVGLAGGHHGEYFDLSAG